jgi:uncharacterized membrane protein
MAGQRILPGTGHRLRPEDGRGRGDRSPTAGDDVTAGWLRLGGVLILVIGAFAVIEGSVALLAPTTYLSVDGTVLTIDIDAWGWVLLVLGVLLVVAGVSLLRGATARACVVGVVLVALSTVVQLAWLPAYPVWAILMIVLDVLVIRALVVTRPDRPLG